MTVGADSISALEGIEKKKEAEKEKEKNGNGKKANPKNTSSRI